MYCRWRLQSLLEVCRVMFFVRNSKTKLFKLLTIKSFLDEDSKRENFLSFWEAKRSWMFHKTGRSWFGEKILLWFFLILSHPPLKFLRLRSCPLFCYCWIIQLHRSNKYLANLKCLKKTSFTRDYYTEKQKISHKTSLEITIHQDMRVVFKCNRSLTLN